MEWKLSSQKSMYMIYFSAVQYSEEQGNPIYQRLGLDPLKEVSGILLKLPQAQD